MRFRIYNSSGGPLLNYWVVVEWASDPLFLDYMYLRTFETAWPYDDQTQQLAVTYVTTVPSLLYVPFESWQQLKQYRVLYYRLGYGSQPIIDSSWTFDPVGVLIIDHPPNANAGSSHVFDLGSNGDLLKDFALDGSGSTDIDMFTTVDPSYRDPGPLNLVWRFVSAPQFCQDASLLQILNNFNSSSSNPTVLPIGTRIDDSCLGTYAFKLTVQDTDIPLSTSQPGVSDDVVQHVIQICNGGLCLFSPTTLNPLTFEFTDNIQVPIIYKIDPTLLTEPSLLGGYRTELRIYDSLSGQKIVTRSTPVPVTDLMGYFYWDGIFDDLSHATSGQLLDVEVVLVDWAGNDIVIPNKQTSDREENSICIQVTSITIDPNATKVVAQNKLLDNTGNISLPYIIDVPNGVNPPDEMSLVIYDATGTSQIDVVGVSLGSPVVWDGTLSSGMKISIPGKYKLQLIAKRSGTVISHSNKHEVKILKFEFILVSTNSVSNGGQTTHVIDFVGPTMPLITIQARMRGLTDAEDGALERNIRIEVTYNQGNRNDDLSFPGPTNLDWFSINPGFQWIPNFANTFCGGELNVYCYATIDGVRIDGKTDPSTHLIWGLNPPKASVRAIYPSLNMQVSSWKESRFTQFSDTSSVAFLNQYRVGPLPVLRSFDNGFGIGQLTIPAPTVNQLWNWNDNASDAIARLQSARQQAITYQNNTKAAHPAVPGVPDFTEDQLDLEMWCRYNSGHRYHNYDPTTNSWIPMPVAHYSGSGLDYADDALHVKQNILAGIFPAGW